MQGHRQKKTRRYTIRTDDVITYLIDREIRPEKYGAPDHWYRDRSGYRKSRSTFRYELSNLSEIEKKLFEEYTQKELASYGDLLSVEETMEITGYSSTAIYRWCNAKKLVGFKISGKFIIPKIGLAEFLISPYSCGIQRKSWRHLLFVSTFLKELKKSDNAKTDEEIYPNNVYQMSGNQITVRTLDLSLPFAEIAEQLNTIAKLHFSL